MAAAKSNVFMSRTSNSSSESAATTASPVCSSSRSVAMRDEIAGVQVAPGVTIEKAADHLDGSSSQGGLRPPEDTETQSSQVDTRSNSPSKSEIDPELAGLDALEDGRPGERPAYPFTTLIRYAIKGSPHGRLLLEDIYNAIQTRYPYFATAPGGWKNSVRHTLSLMTCFEKVPRLLTEPGKGSYWTVNDLMPHAKPSRIRIRKRKARADDDEALLATPRSVPDVLQTEASGGGNFTRSDHYGRAYSFDQSGSSARRHSSYVQGDLVDPYATYSYDMRAHRPEQYSGNSWHSDAEINCRPVVRAKNQPTLEPILAQSHGSHLSQPCVEPQQVEEKPPSGETQLSIDYRLVLMSDLEKLRNAIGRRDDIDREWCRLMVERLRGTGLDF
ncbi:hypothetical protein CTheo_2574 [Ceratobasidium theobromae]|uniref:Fork-head domain-containing protein n=1 Tax=Ceratobasidium theobromae TaxID=1582974 RepID=A0A5N5QQZ0_9AGAM|nr:hypothetical protein CTheo_2574 [Ceratobasidium theobromae]